MSSTRGILNSRCVVFSNHSNRSVLFFFEMFAAVPVNPVAPAVAVTPRCACISVSNGLMLPVPSAVIYTPAALSYDHTLVSVKRHARNVSVVAGGLRTCAL